MKKVLPVSILILLLSILHAQNWNELTSVPGAGREAPFSFSLNGKIYLGGGVNGLSGSNSFYIFDITTNTWTPKANLPDYVWGAAYFVLNGKGYVVAGQDNAALVSAVYQYDPILDQWNTMSNFPGPCRENCFGFSIGDTGYIFGGFPGGSGHTELNDLWAYNPTNDTWSQRASMPSSGRSGAGGFVLNNTAYIGLGEYSSGANFPSDMYAYHPDSNAWNIIAQYPGHVGNGPLSYIIGKRAYLGMGVYLDPNTNSADYYYEFYEYNPTANTWVASDSFNGPGRSNAICQQIGDTIYLGSGQGPSGGLIDWWVNIPTATGVKSISENGVSIYPNPFSDHIVINIGDVAKDVEITVSDLLGQNIFRKVISNAGPTITLSSSELNNAQGLVFVSVSSNNTVKTFKLVANQ